MEKKSDFKIPSKIKAYKIEKELYSISKGHICIGTNLNINEKVLIKIYDKEIICYEPEEVSLINNEIFILKLMKHNCILKLYEIIESPSYIYLVMEYFNGKRLFDYINTKKALSEDDSVKIYKQLMSILVYMHDINICHLNINPYNIIVDNYNNIRLFEFKYSKFYSNEDRTKCDFFGDKNCLPPELYSKKSCLPELSDVWSSGVILYLLINGKLPFIAKNVLDLQNLIMKGEYNLSSNMSKNMKELVKNILVKEENRFNIDKIFESELFKQKKITKNNIPFGINILSKKFKCRNQ